jgi:hypothetical protein
MQPYCYLYVVEIIAMKTEVNYVFTGAPEVCHETFTGSIDMSQALDPEQFNITFWTMEKEAEVLRRILQAKGIATPSIKNIEWIIEKLPPNVRPIVFNIVENFCNNGLAVFAAELISRIVSNFEAGWRLDTSMFPARDTWKLDTQKIVQVQIILFILKPCV